MAKREIELQKLAVGDIFHGRSPNRASLICLVTAVDEATIYARRIHTQDDLQFDRTTGIQIGDVPSKIDCVTPFPPDIHKIFLEMDRKHREHTELFRKGVEPDSEQRKLSADEKRALLSINEHIAVHPI